MEERRRGFGGMVGSAWQEPVGQRAKESLELEGPSCVGWDEGTEGEESSPSEDKGLRRTGAARGGEKLAAWAVAETWRRVWLE